MKMDKFVNRKIVIIGLLIIISVITGCGNKESTENIVTEVTCSSPYFEYKTGECCLDKDSNRVCDTDEKSE